jgi:hypothetical protein
MEITIADTLDETIWRAFVDQHPQGTIFHTPEMFQVYARAKGYRPGLRAGLNGKNQVLALVAPVLVSLTGGLLHRLTTRSIAYGSILCAPDLDAKTALTGVLLDYTRKQGREGLFTELRHLSDVSAYQPEFNICNFKYQEELNYLIDLDGTAEEIFSRLGSRTRKHIRRELKKGEIMVDEVQHSSQIRPFYDLIKKSYHEAHVPIADISLFEAAFEILHPLNMVKFLIVRLGNASIASSVELIYKDVIYGWYGGVDRAYSNRTPSELLTWYILKWGAENGYRTYDFGGAGIPGEKYGVRDFKAKFGGRLVCYGRNTCVHARGLLRLSMLGYSALRTLLKIEGFINGLHASGNPQQIV